MSVVFPQCALQPVPPVSLTSGAPTTIQVSLAGSVSNCPFMTGSSWSSRSSGATIVPGNGTGGPVSTGVLITQPGSHMICYKVECAMAAGQPAAAAMSCCANVLATNADGSSNGPAQNTCAVDANVNCKLASGISCTERPPALNTGTTCVEKSFFEYTFENIGTMNMEVTSAQRTINGGAMVDLADQVSPNPLSPGQVGKILEELSIDYCQMVGGNFGVNIRAGGACN